MSFLTIVSKPSTIDIEHGLLEMQSKIEEILPLPPPSPSPSSSSPSSPQPAIIINGGATKADDGDDGGNDGAIDDSKHLHFASVPRIDTERCGGNISERLGHSITVFDSTLFVIGGKLPHNDHHHYFSDVCIFFHFFKKY